MINVARRPFMPARSFSQAAPADLLSPVRAARTTVTKRPRSPDPGADYGTAESSSKRVRAASPTVTRTVNATDEEKQKEKERRRAEREAQRREFQVKYVKAFPSFAFYIDVDAFDDDGAIYKHKLSSKIVQLGGRIDDFFSNDITHLITNKPLPPNGAVANKENLSRTPVGSPVKPLTGKDVMNVPESTYDDLIVKAIEFNMKIWDVVKLESVLERCLAPPVGTSTATRAPSASASREPSALSRASSISTTASQQPLAKLLKSERVHGTLERDPTQRRHDYRYFSKGSRFVLVEDLKRELATIYALEYPVTKSKDGAEKGAWPVLHCHPKTRGPFFEFNEKEQRRWETTDKADREREKERERAKLKLAEELKRKQRRASLQNQASKALGHHDLRKSASMNNLRRSTTLPTLFQKTADGARQTEEGDLLGSFNASGYLPSTGAYVAASGNSVGITSTTGTTSTANGPLRNVRLPPALQDRHQFVTSRKFGVQGEKDKEKEREKGTMGPPPDIPSRRNVLKKSRSTNTVRLPKRDEGCKPGYCESCRQKFDDFADHIRSRRHRKFAMDDANFEQLDFVLARVRRRTRQEVEEEDELWERRMRGEDEQEEEHGDGEELQEGEDQELDRTDSDVVMLEDD